MAENITEGAERKEFVNYKNPYSSILIESKNLIFRGAPGTGKSYLAKKIAADIISNGKCENYSDLSAEQKKQVEFVQFHPSYDYSDFVEGLRPKINADGSMGFELRDGIFKRFVNCARNNQENLQDLAKTAETVGPAQGTLADFLASIKFNVDKFKIKNGNDFIIDNIDKEYIHINIPNNKKTKNLTLDISELRQMIEAKKRFEKVKDITAFFKKENPQQKYSYYLALYKEYKKGNYVAVKAEAKKYVFIIDEINRGEISKIFGELFFAIDPDYRGKIGEISTQYQSLHSDPDEKFYVPENVYIIGTMNDIDRSVDSFDFAMRRRFRFIEIKANDNTEMLSLLGEKEKDAENRMIALNNEIAATEDLNENYQIGAAYFLKLKTIDFEQLWDDHLKPLLEEYIKGMADEKKIMDKFEKAYFNPSASSEEINETTENQG